MAVIALASFAGAPGVTTTALAMTFAWHRPALLVEADTAKTSSILPGYLRGQYQHAHGLTQLAVAQQNNAMTGAEILEQRLELAPERNVILGFTSVLAGQSTSALWGPFGTTLSTLDSAGMDVIVDMGRLASRDDRAALLQIADSVLIVLQPTLPDITAAAMQITELRDLLAQAGHRDYLEVLLVDTLFAERWGSADISKLLQVDVVAKIVHDERSASVYYSGKNPHPGFARSAYTKSIRAAQATIRERIDRRRESLGLRPARQEVTP